MPRVGDVDICLLGISDTSLVEKSLGYTIVNLPSLLPADRGVHQSQKRMVDHYLKGSIAAPIVLLPCDQDFQTQRSYAAVKDAGRLEDTMFVITRAEHCWKKAEGRVDDARVIQVWELMCSHKTSLGGFAVMTDNTSSDDATESLRFASDPFWQRVLDYDQDQIQHSNNLFFSCKERYVDNRVYRVLTDL